MRLSLSASLFLNDPADVEFDSLPRGILLLKLIDDFFDIMHTDIILFAASDDCDARQ
jgi:hypothetical protein